MPQSVDWLRWEDRFIERVQEIVRDDRFLGVPVSHLVHSFLVLFHRHGRLKSPGCRPSQAWGDLLRTLAHPHGWRFLQRPDPRAWQSLQGRILIAGLSPQARWQRWWQPLASTLGPDRCLLLAAGRSQLGQPPRDLPRVAVSDFPAAWWRTRAWTLGRLPRWTRALQTLTAELDLHPAARLRLAAALVAQLNKVAATLALHDRLKPRAVVVPWDRDPFGAVLCAALGSRGVPTFTFVHGAFGIQNHASFVPLGARYVFTWGDVQTDLLAAAGVARDRLHPVGVFEPRPARAVLADRDRAARLQQLGLPPDRPVVLVGLTCLTAKEVPAWAGILRELSARLPAVSVLARLHPSNSRQSFATWLTEGGNLRLADDRQISAAQCLDLADVVLVDSSSFGFDALQRSIPVVVLQPPDGSGLLTVMREAVVAGAARFARDAGDAAAQLADLLGNTPASATPSTQAPRAEPAEAFVRTYVCAWGPEAVQRAVAAIDRVCSSAHGA